MAFVIHLQLGAASESQAQTSTAHAARARSPGWWTHRWSSRRDYDEHLRRTFGPLAGGAGRSVADERAADVRAADVLIPLADEDLCEDLGDASE